MNSRTLATTSLILTGISMAALVGGCPQPPADNENTNGGGSNTNINGGSNTNANGGSNTNANGGSNANTNAGGNTNANVDPGNTNANASPGNSNTNASNGNANTGGGFPNTANSIVAADGGTRNDPEGVAAPTAVKDVTWFDARGVARTMTLGGYLYEYDFSFDDGQQLVQRTANDDAYGHEGFGYVVSHNTVNGNSPLGKANPPTALTTTVLTGGHHAIHRIELIYDRDREGGGEGIKIPVVIDWFVMTGRDHPIWAVTYKTGEIQNPNNINFDTYRMDVRGPYGSLNFDGAANRNAGDAVGGVAWGDFGLKFMTTDAQFTLQSPWTYNTPNQVCFTQAWTANINAEMGIVQTRTGDKQMGYQDRVVGRERGTTSAANFTDRQNCNAFGDNRVYSAPCINGWPYQLMNFDWAGPKPLNEATGTKLIAWGSPYGWLGASTFSLFDFSATADGRGDRSYSTFIVLGPKCRIAAGNVCSGAGDVAETISQVTALSAARVINATVGTIATSAPRGPGATGTKTLTSGYDDTYATFVVDADATSRAAFTFSPAAGQPVDAPVFRVRNFTARTLPVIRVNGAAVTVNTGNANAGAFVSLDAGRNELWITMNAEFAADTTIQVGE